jgi:hypothetical protein
MTLINDAGFCQNAEKSPPFLTGMPGMATAWLSPIPDSPCQKPFRLVSWGSLWGYGTGVKPGPLRELADNF